MLGNHCYQWNLLEERSFYVYIAALAPTEYSPPIESILMLTVMSPELQLTPNHLRCTSAASVRGARFLHSVECRIFELWATLCKETLVLLPKGLPTALVLLLKGPPTALSSLSASRTLEYTVSTPQQHA